MSVGGSGAAIVLTASIVAAMVWTMSTAPAGSSPSAVAREARPAAAPDGATIGTPWRRISAGGSHTCGIRGGRLYCWGGDGDGQLGDGRPLANRDLPVEVKGGADDWREVSAGYMHTCAIRSTGQLYCWGWDGHGNLGNGDPMATTARPVEVLGGANRWRAVSTGLHHTCAITTTNRLFCWGSDRGGRLGNVGRGDREPPKTRPVEVAAHTTDWRSVSAGGDHTCAIRTNRRLYCWGRNVSGQLGTGGALDQQADTPVEIAGDATNWTSVGAGSQGSCATKSNGRLLCWGSDYWGQLADGGANTDRPIPGPVVGTDTDWRTVAMTGFSACATKSDGRLFCWPGAAPGVPVPVEVVSEPTDWRTVSLGSSHTCGLRAGGLAFCWGTDDRGQLGNGPDTTAQPDPIPVA